MKRLCLIVLLAAIVCMVGCKSTPPERIVTAIGIINAGTTDYITHCQPLLKDEIAAKNDEMNAETDAEKKAALKTEVMKLIDFYKLGNEIPPTLQELEDWATGKPLPEEKDDGG